MKDNQLIWFGLFFACVAFTQVAFPAPSEADNLFPHTALLWEVSSLANHSQAGSGIDVLGIEDINGDGHPDVLCSYDNRLVVMKGDGKGKFTPGPWSYYELQQYHEGSDRPGRFVDRKWTLYAPQEINGVQYVPKGDVVFPYATILDIDGDGFLDVAVVATFIPDGGEKAENKLYIFHNTGNGQFVPVSQHQLEFTPDGIWASDFNGDGRIDLLLSDQGNDQSTEIYACYGEKHLSFSAPAVVLQGEGELFHVGDVTGDGAIDLCFFANKGITIVPSDGKGGFSQEESLSPVDQPIQAATVGDLNGDGHPDLILATADQVVTVIWRKTGFKTVGRLNLGKGVWNLWTADLDGDGHMDVLVEVSNGYSDFLVIPGDGKGGLLRVGGAFVVPDAPYRNVWFSDLNGDGRTDIVFPAFSGARCRIYLNGGTPRGVSIYSSPGKPLAAGDLDGNGNKDIVIGTENGIGVFWNSGHGFIYSDLITGIPTPLAGAVVNGKLYVLSVMENIGTVVQVFTSSGQLIKVWRVDGTAVPVLAVGDFDNDGKKDIAFPIKNKLFILWSGQELRGYSWPKGDLSLIAAAPHNNLFAVSTGDYANIVRVSLVGRKLQLTPPLLQVAALPLSLAVGNIDGDGIPDVVTIASTFKVEGQGDDARLVTSGAILGMVLSSVGAKQVEINEFPDGDAPWAFDGLRIGDFTGDGIPDVAYTTVQGAGLFIMPGKGDGTFAETVRVDVPAGPLVTADLDGNGEGDIAVCTVGTAPLLAIRWNGGER